MRFCFGLKRKCVILCGFKATRSLVNWRPVRCLSVCPFRWSLTLRSYGCFTGNFSALCVCSVLRREVLLWRRWMTTPVASVPAGQWLTVAVAPARKETALPFHLHRHPHRLLRLAITQRRPTPSRDRRVRRSLSVCMFHVSVVVKRFVNSGSTV